MSEISHKKQIAISVLKGRREELKLVEEMLDKTNLPAFNTRRHLKVRRADINKEIKLIEETINVNLQK